MTAPPPPSPTKRRSRPYRKALSILAEDTSGVDWTSKASVELRYKFAEVLWRTARHDECREMLDEALRLVKPEDTLLAALLQVRLGRVEINAHNHGAAVAAFDAAEALLGEDPTRPGPGAGGSLARASVGRSSTLLLLAQ